MGAKFTEEEKAALRLKMMQEGFLAMKKRRFLSGKYRSDHWQMLRCQRNVLPSIREQNRVSLSGDALQAPGSQG